MLTILVLFVGLTLATAVIAYWSDNLGKKLGKKRVSLWGMRPRTTATFLTIASSWLIMIFTLGVMLTLFKPLRQALLRYDKVVANEKELKTSATKLTGQVGDLSNQLATLTNQTKTFKKQVETASENLRMVTDKLDQSRTAATRAQREQQTAEKEAASARKRANDSLGRERAAIKRETSARDNLKTVTNQRNATQAQRDAAQRELKAAKTELVSAKAAAIAAAAQVEVAENGVKIAQNKAKNAQAQFKTAQTDLRNAQGDLRIAQTNEKSAISNADSARKSAENSKRLAKDAENRAEAAGQRADAADKRGVTVAIEVGRKVLAADAQVIAVEKQVIASEKQVAEAQKVIEQLELQRAELIRDSTRLFDDKNMSDLKRQIVQSSDIRVPFGFTLVARTFEPGLSPAEVERQLHDLFNYVATKIVPGDKKRNIPAVLSGATLRLAPQRAALPKEEESDPDVFISVEEDEIYGSLATAISRTQTPLSVRLVAVRNQFDGEPVLDTRFTILPERLALAADTELARLTFKEKLSDAQLFSALLNLTDIGREVAKDNFVTPPLSPDTKDFFAPGSTERIFEALRKVSALDGRARVILYTDKAISTADQLSVRFEVEPLQSVVTQAAARVAPPKSSFRAPLR